MRILFTADIHIKLGQKGVPTEWAKNRFNLLWKVLKEKQRESDLFIVGGDVFDKLPNMEELETYFDLVSSCVVETIIIPGNHEATKKNATFLSNLKQVTARLNPLVRIIDNFETYKDIDFIPYNKLKEWEKNPELFKTTGRILVSHFRGEIPPHVKPEIDLKLFQDWSVVLAGDLHSHENSQLNIIYPGSPITTSFHRNFVDTGVVVLDSETLDYTFQKLELPQLLRKTISAGDPMPATEYHHTVYEVTGDMSELANMEDNDLLDKKLVKRNTDSALILDSEMSIGEEVKEYLTYILQLDEKTIEEALKELQNNIGALS